MICVKATAAIATLSAATAFYSSAQNKGLTHDGVS